MKRDFTLKQLLLSLGGILLLVTSVILCIAYIQKKQFYDHVKKTLDSDVYYCYYEGKDFYATSNQIKTSWNSNTGTFEGRGFTLSIYEIYRYNPMQVIWKYEWTGTITYKKRPMKKEQYYEPGYWNGSSSDILDYVPGEFKERYVQGDFDSPHIVYQYCWEAIKKELNDVNGKQITDTDSVNKELFGRSHYYGLNQIDHTTNKREYSCEYYSLPIGQGKTTYKASMWWNSILEDIIFYSLLIFTIPVLLYLWKNIRKNKALMIWLLLHYLLLLLSTYSANKDDWAYTFFRSDTYKTIWPFTDKIVEKRKETIFLGKDPNMGANVSQETGRTYIHSIRPVAGYDFSEFVVYCALGYLLLRKRKDENNNLEENDKDENEANIE